MAFCAICQRYHDPDMGCFDNTGQVLRNMGIEGEDKHTPENKLQRNELKTRWIILLISLGVLIIAIIVALIYTYGKVY